MIFSLLIFNSCISCPKIVNLIENWGEKVDENWGDSLSSFVMSSQRGMAHAIRYFKLEWIFGTKQQRVQIH